MLINILVLLCFVLEVYSARVTNPSKVPKNAVLLSKVSSLTLRTGKQTSARRVSSVSQLKCVGPSKICNLYDVDVMRCTNEGADYDQENIQWACKATLPEEFKLGSTDVSCEGYESSEDPYVLKGSCGVEYRLLLTDKGDEKYGPKVTFDIRSSSKTFTSEKYAGYLFMIVFFGVLVTILYNIYKAWRNDTPRTRGTRLGRGGGGGGPGDDPPPPYSPYPRSTPKKPNTSSGSGSSRSYGGSQRQQGWQPGFWTGTATGAAAGYMAGNRNQRAAQPETTQTGPRRGWFGGGGGGGGGAGNGTAPGSSSSSPSYSSSRHDSMGFGGTSRR